MPNLELRPRKVLPRCESGIDHNAPRIVLVEHADGRRLEWRKAATYWRNRRVGYVPLPGALSLVAAGAHYAVGSAVLYAEGGRLSAALIARFADRIDAFFGAPVTGSISIKHTLFVTDLELP